MLYTIYNWEISSGENQELPQKEYNKMDKQENKQTVGSNSEDLKEQRKKNHHSQMLPKEPHYIHQEQGR